MSFMDKVREKAQGLAGKNPEKVNQRLDTAAQKADEKTGGKYSEKIDQGTGKAKEFLGSEGGQEQQGQEQQSQEQQGQESQQQGENQQGGEQGQQRP